MFRFVKAFTKAFINDIEIYSYTFKEHIKHFKSVFSILRKKGVTILLGKLFIGYLSVTLLKQRVDYFNMSIPKEKIAAITNLYFPAVL